MIEKLHYITQPDHFGEHIGSIKPVLSAGCRRHVGTAGAFGLRRRLSARPDVLRATPGERRMRAG